MEAEWKVKKQINRFFDIPPTQVHGPGAVQVLGFDWPDEKTVTMGDKNLS